MKERFINFFRTVLDIPPSYEEAYLNFRHGKNCTGSQNLVTYSVSRPIAPFDPSAMGNCRNEIMVDINYLECPECHSSVRFSGKVDSKRV